MFITVIDIETTDFFARGGLIVEVGMVVLDTETGELDIALDSCCREPGLSGKHHDAWIFKNSPMTHDDVRNAPTFEELKEDIQRIIDHTDGFTAFNKAFDLEFLRDRGIQLPVEKELDCPMRVLTPIMKLKKTGRAAYYGGYKWPNVMEAWAYLFPGVPYCEIHRGADDAFHEAKILHKMIQDGTFNLPECKTARVND